MTEEYIEVRLSDLLRYCSVGAIVRTQKGVMVVNDIRRWISPGRNLEDQQIRHVDRICKALGIANMRLCTPPHVTEQEDDGAVSGWIPASRFPKRTRCLKCGLMHWEPWKEKRGDNEWSCGGTETETGDICSGELEQVPWVLVHGKGYLTDVPWHDLVHDNASDTNECNPDWEEPYLKMQRSGIGIGQSILCTRCQCRSDERLPLRFYFPRNCWQQPWINEYPDSALEEPAWILQINDARIHSASNNAALVIPPESRVRQGTITDRLYNDLNSQEKIRNAKNELARKSAVRQVADDYDCETGEIENSIRDIDGGYPLYGQEIKTGDLFADEYEVLVREIHDFKEDEDFVTKHWTREWKALAQNLGSGVPRRVVNIVSNLVAVNKLKEIMVLKGFRRAGGRELVPPDIVGESRWLPALELYGEGIFVTLDEAILQRWESVSKVLWERADTFSKRFAKKEFSFEFEINPSPRFLLCHTLAHLMIRQLDAVADEEGSLGGLMEMAKPERFLRLLTSVFETATWCSLDPVCSEQDGQGPDLLNRAACHACALVPEPSCSYGNILLDRTFINGCASQFPGLLDCVDGGLED
ncbi:MAG: hypothetical protein F4235_06365 [Candidatus Dadabacteria bacterium]|nr:hypothetical protein [Candidatus Dadabacteria bacterium]